jgi:DNA (cytosine-5)-methyltransferase 1
MLTFGSLFAGIGGIDLGLERAGMTCKWQVEIDPFCQKVLKKHWPDVARYEDVRTVGKHNLERVDLIAGGFPCQDVALIGAGRGLDGERSTLWFEYLRIVREIRPSWILAENVTGLLSANDGDFFGEVQRGLAESGYTAEWQTLQAGAFGAPHERERVFILCHADEIPGIQAGQPALPILSSREARRDYRTEHRQIVSAVDWRKDPSQFLRVVDGLSAGLDEHRRGALGNAVVPQVAEWLGRQILANA